MAKYNVFYKFGDRVAGTKGFYVGMKGKVIGMKRPLFGDDQFFVKFDEVEVPVWVDSWDLWYDKN